jgi:hypothetical protein
MVQFLCTTGTVGSGAFEKKKLYRRRRARTRDATQPRTVHRVWGGVGVVVKVCKR